MVSPPFSHTHTQQTEIYTPKIFYPKILFQMQSFKITVKLFSKWTVQFLYRFYFARFISTRNETNCTFYKRYKMCSTVEYRIVSKNVSGFYDRKSKSGLMPELLQLSAHWIRNKQILVLPRISIDKKFQTITIFYLPTFSNMYRNERTFSHSSSYRSTGAHFWRNDWRSPALPHVIKFLEIHTQNTTNCFTVDFTVDFTILPNFGA